MSVRINNMAPRIQAIVIDIDGRKILVGRGKDQEVYVCVREADGSTKTTTLGVEDEYSHVDACEIRKR